MQENIKAAIKAAMIAKEMDKLQVLRMISAAFTNELVSQGRPPTDPLSDDDAMKVLKRLSNQRKDSINQFTAGGRPDLAESEMAELAIIETLLPAQMSREEIANKVKEAIAAQGGNIANKGPFMGQMMKALGGTADGTVVKEVIDELLG